MVARSFGGTPRRRPTSPSTRDAGGAPRSSARRFVTRRNPSSLDSTLHSRETLFLSPIHEHVDTQIKHASRAQTLSHSARLDPASRRRPFRFVSKLFRVSRARAVHRDVRGKEDASNAALIDVRPSCARIERASRATPAKERANTASVGSSSHPYCVTRVCVERCRR